VPLTPPQIVALEELYPNVEFFVQPSDLRCYSNEEYEYLDIPLKEDIRDCDILLGVKEVDKRTLYPERPIYSSAMLPRNNRITLRCSKQCLNITYPLSILNILLPMKDKELWLLDVMPAL